MLHFISSSTYIHSNTKYLPWLTIAFQLKLMDLIIATRIWMGIIFLVQKSYTSHKPGLGTGGDYEPHPFPMWRRTRETAPPVSDNWNPFCVAVEEVTKLVREWAGGQLRSRMKVGIPELGLPPLEPLPLPDFPFQLHHGDYYSIHGRVRNILLLNLSSFNLTRVETHLPARSDLNLTMTLPILTLTGDYEVRGLMLRVFPISRSGPLSIVHRRVTQNFYLELEVDEGTGAVSISSLTFVMSLEGVKVAFGGLGGNRREDEMVNSFINSFSTELWRALEPTLRREVGKAMKAQLNWSFRSLRLPQILRDKGKAIIC